MRLVLAGLVLVASVLIVLQLRVQPGDRTSEHWEQRVRLFEEQDRAEPPPENAVLFIGSSSIGGWDLDRFFPNLETINRGFGGSKIRDSTFYASRLITPHRPRVVVLYAGDNDLVADDGAHSVYRDFIDFVDSVREDLPETRIVFMSIKPSLKRWAYVEQIRQANELIAQFSKERECVDFVDVFGPMLGANGRPRPEIFSADGLHLNEEGYELWTSLVEPFLTSASEETARHAGDESTQRGSRAAGDPIPLGWGMGKMSGSTVWLGNEYDAALRALHGARISVFSLDFTQADHHSLEGPLMRLSDDTGGFYRKTVDFPNLAINAVRKAIDGYYELVVRKPDAAHGRHRIRVRLVGRRGDLQYKPFFVGARARR